MRIRTCLLAIALAVVTLPTAAFVASADDGSPIRPEVGGPPIRPPLSELRNTQWFPLVPAPQPVRTGQVDDPIPAFPPSAATQRELVIVVGGYQSEFKDQKPVRDFIDGLALGPHYKVIRFGEEPEFRYDTLGSLDDNARRLSEEILSKAPNYSGVHIVAHSMGGNVVDRAFVRGYLPDGGPILTYTALSTPHAGSTAAREAELTLTLAGPARADTNEAGRMIDVEADTPAMKDLAARLERPHLRRVARLDIRMATDLVVSAADAEDPGVEARTLIPHTLASIDGHGGTLVDPMSRQFIRNAILERGVPRDERSIFEKTAAGPLSFITDSLSSRFVASLCIGVLFVGVGIWLARELRRRRDSSRLRPCVAA